MKIIHILEDMEYGYDPCTEKTILFYQSNNGKELLEIMRQHLEKHSIDQKYKMDKITKRRLKFLLSLVPKC